MAGVLAERYGFRAAALDDLVHWADIIDGAQFPDARMPVELAEPALRLMTWIENNPDPALTHRYIAELPHRTLAELAEEPWVAGPLAPLLAEHRRHIELIRARARCDAAGVVSFDLTEDGVAAHNKFIAYWLFPAARYTVGVTRSPARCKISVGSNPWARETRTHDIARICERYGGGGHPVVGAVSLPRDQVDRARQIATEIRAELAT
jgi:hypothetical protein